jgi:MOSC domain-containing protein
VRVVELWRYPVKSLGGEPLPTSEVLATGLVGDRAWGIRDAATGYVLTARREPRLLFASAHLLANGEAEIVLPDGTLTTEDAGLSRWLGRPVELVRAGSGTATFEGVEDPGTELEWTTWDGAPGTFHDMAAARVSVVSTGTLGEWDVRRFRTNVVLDGAGEDELTGQTVRVGGCLLTLTTRIGRCVMVTRAQPGLERDLDVLKAVNRRRDGCLSVGATVERPGRITVGDTVSVHEASDQP